MTAPDTLERERTRQKGRGLYLTDEQIAAELGVSPKDLAIAICDFAKDRRWKFPPRDPLFGGRRYWPAVKRYFDRRNGLAAAGPEPVGGEEHWD